jgi:hypothetical protein
LTSTRHDIFELEEWTPSGYFYVTPTLVLLWGNNERLCGLGNSLDQRLASLIDTGIVRWKLMSDPNKDITDNQINNLIESLLKHDALERWLDGGLIEYIPDIDHPAKLRFIVVCDLLGYRSGDGIEAWLNKLAKLIKKLVDKRVEYTMVLLIIGDPNIDVEKVRNFWPRIYLGEKGWGGTKVDQVRLYQSSENVLVSIISSELIRFIDYKISHNDLSVKWISLGAASLIVDLNSLKKKLQNAIFIDLIEPLVKGSLTKPQFQLLDNTAKIIAERFQTDLLNGLRVDGEIVLGAREISEAQGWQLDVDDREVKSCSLLSGTTLTDEVFRSSWWVNIKTKYIKSNESGLKRWLGWSKFQFQQLVEILHRPPLPILEKLSSILTSNYIESDKILHTKLAKRASLAFYDLLDSLLFILDRDAFAGERKELPLDPNIHYPTGLQAVIYTLNVVIERLSKSTDLVHEGKYVKPAPLGSEDYWSAASDEDVSTIEGSLLKYRRFMDRLTSPLGLSLKLFVAWPLLTGLIDTITKWNLGEVVLISGVILALLGLIELLIWHIKGKRLLYKVRNEIYGCLKSRILSLVARALYDYRLVAISRLLTIKRLLRELYAKLSDEHRYWLQEWEKREELTKSSDEGAKYWLVDFTRALGNDRVEITGYLSEKWPPLVGEVAYVWKDIEHNELRLSWRSEARRGANVEAQRVNENYRKAETCIIAQSIFPLFRHPTSGIGVIKSLRNIGIKWMEKEFKPQLLEVYTLAEENNGLKDGRKWQWLFNRARPLGGSRKNDYSQSFTVITAYDESSISGVTGKYSSFWHDDWLVVRSRQPGELGCIRGVIEA